jgi:uncharacterized phage protein (TIGR01671 family)
MREIKFRAIRKEGNPLKYHFTLNDLTNGSVMLFMDDYHWCQFTGLKDRNGKEIYEGDIVTSKTV